MAGKGIALPQEISADPWSEGNPDGRQRPRCEVGREAGWPLSTDEAANPRGAKGAIKMRTMKTEQLNLVFAESPQGSGDKPGPDLWAGAASRLHTAKVKEFEGFMAGAISGPGAAVYAVCFRDTIQRAGCVIRQSGSERGAVV